MHDDDEQVIRLEDYRPTDFLIHEVDLLVCLFEGRAEVRAALTVERRPGSPEAASLSLDGDELTLTSLALDGERLPEGSYEVSPEALTLHGLPASGRFTLSIGTTLEPEKNTKLMGLYRTRGVWCTQCEAEGFRRITYFLDRPDVLATYRVRIEAPRAAAPVLLANGNPVESGPLEGGRHFALWHDPHPKPSYLFALVAGDLDVLKDDFTTAGGRKVDLAIYTEKGLSARSVYAMDALKRSMAWDERRFGREYDLDVFNIVAVSDFNMGAMENKGLNVFNHKYVLLDPDTATDGDYAGVETVIAHEYFHNWTGNRITCRDWFQLCLKEGLTVYRDQEFTADERSRAVKRIASVQLLKSQQFPEDQGPLQHPVRPTRYREINNFYTATVYDKGAELVRMIATILGPERFRAGMDLYFERHDGEAATIEDFLLCFEEAGGRSLERFRLWYAQAGTPTLSVRETYADGRLTLSLSQRLARGAAGTGTEPMHMPVRFGLVGSNGADMEAVPRAEGAKAEDGIIHLLEEKGEVVFEGLPERPLVSILRDFSAPVTLDFPQSREDRLALARLDPDAFGRWRALADLVGETLADAGRTGFSPADAAPVLQAVAAGAADEALEPSLRAQMAALPGEGEIARLVGQDVDPGRVHRARIAAMAELGRIGGESFARLLAEGAGEPFSPAPDSVGRRALRNTILAFVSLAAGDASRAERQFAGATNMTDRLAALAVLAHHFPREAATRKALERFHDTYAGDDLVLDKWFMLQASAAHEDALADVERLAAHPAFKLANPNRARALIGGFASANPLAFHRPDGAGYRFVARMLTELDRLNPQTAARLATAFRSWRSLEPGRRELAAQTLRAIAQGKQISRDLKDIVDRSLQ
ncbi:aminopeptidase N [Aureimonas populi]|uniref:Aminopeptidase N n=1 Tax=Aureimonas populi TaxID=1701758 RepID=A0ABW5CIE2_9HYPH|nr:aminopeptidase N [Aureimonas populi]